MTLQKRFASSSAVFDVPGKQQAGGLITRRLWSLASRPVLALRNQPVKTGSGAFPGKCFCLSSLYRITKTTKKVFKLKISLNCVVSSLFKGFRPPNSFLPPSLQEPKKRLELSVKNLITNVPPTPFTALFRKGIPEPCHRKLKLERQADRQPLLKFNIITRQNEEKIRPLTACVASSSDFASFFFWNKESRKTVELEFLSGAPEISDITHPANEFKVSSPAKIKFTPQSKWQKVSCNSDFSALINKTCDNLSRFRLKSPTVTRSILESRSEIGRNLFLEAKEPPKLRCGNLLPAEPVNHDRFKLKRFDSQIRSFAFSSLFNSHQQFSSLSVLPEIKPQTPPSNLPGLFLLPGGNKCRPFATTISFSASIATNMPKFKLKLRLKRIIEPGRLHGMQLLHRQDCKIFARPVEKLIIASARVQKAPLRQIYFSDYKGASIKDLFKNFQLRQKKLSLRFLTRSQAKYTLSRLRSIKKFNFPVKPAQIAVKDQHLRGKIGNKTNFKSKFSHSIKNFSDFVQLLGRPAAFFMTLTKMDFTDISLPIHCRKLKTPKGLFSAAMLCKIRRSAMALTTLNHQIVESYQFWPKKAQKGKMVPFRQHFKCYTAQATQGRFLSNYVFAPDLPGERLTGICCQIDELISFKSKANKPAPASLPLHLIHCGIKSPVKLSGGEIIAPPPWPKTTKSYVCRLRLPPFPFGFPKFSFNGFSMKSLNSTYRPPLSADRFTRLFAHHYQFSLQTKTIRSKFSLKDPRHWLFAEPDLSESPIFAVHFKGYSDTIDRSLDAPKVPKNFSFTGIKFFANQKMAFQFKNILDQKRELSSSKHFFQHGFTNAALLFCQKVEMQLRIYRQKIKRLLLQNRRNECISLASPIKDLDLRIGCYGINRNTTAPDIPETETFLQRISPQQISCREILAFYFSFNHQNLARVLMYSKYQALFRQFHFPYSPDFVDFSREILEFFSIDDTSNLVETASGEEIRSSQITIPSFYSVDKMQYHFERRLFCRTERDMEHFNAPPYPTMQLSFFTRQHRRKNRLEWNRSSHPYKRFIPPGRLQEKLFASQLSNFFAEMPSTDRFTTADLVVCKESPIEKPNFKKLYHKLDFDAPHWIILLKKTFRPVGEIRHFKKTHGQAKPRNEEFRVCSRMVKEKVAANLFGLLEQTNDFSVFTPGRPLFFVAEKLRLIELKTRIKKAKISERTIGNFNGSAPMPCLVENFMVKNEFIQNKSAKPELKVIKLFKSTEISLSDFKMHEKTGRNCLSTRPRGQKVRPWHTDFKPAFVPEWLEMGTLHVDLNL